MSASGFFPSLPLAHREALPCKHEKNLPLQQVLEAQDVIYDGFSTAAFETGLHFLPVIIEELELFF